MGILRFLLALFVIIHHSNGIFGFRYLNPTLAIQSFFVVSGFYMALILKEKYVGKDSLYIFYSNRFLRIFPTYWLILLLTLVFSYYWYFHGLAGLFDLQPTHYFPYENSYLYASPLVILRDITIVLRTDYLQINPNYNQFLTISQAWTLVLELCFYLVAPFIVIKPKRILSLLLLSGLILFLINYNAINSNIPLTHRFFPAEIFYFLLGSLSYYLFIRIKKMQINRAKIVGLSIFYLLFTIFFGFITFNFPERWVNFGYIFFVLTLVLFIPFLFLSSSKNKFDTFMGDLSFPMYISHMLIIYIFVNIFNGNVFNNYFSIFVILTTILFSSSLVFFFERPIDRWRQTRLKKKK